MSPDRETAARPPWTSVGLFLIAAIAALKVASVLALPVVVSVLLTLLLAPPVAWLKRHGISEKVGAALLVFGSVTAVIAALSFLAAPASKWIGEVPDQLRKAEHRLHAMVRPLSNIQESMATVDSVSSAAGTNGAPVVKLAKPGLLSRLSGSSLEIGGEALEVIFLSFFLLAAAPLFREKLVRVWPGRRERREVEQTLAEIEEHMSRYLWMTTVMNLGVALLTWGLLALTGFPNPLLWAVLAGIVNYVPYAGPLALSILLAFIGMVAGKSLGTIAVATGGYLLIHGVQSNLIAPLTLEKKLPLNPVALFAGLMFFGWLWGVTGAVLAVPLTVMIQVVCARIPATENLALLLDS